MPRRPLLRMSLVNFDQQIVMSNAAASGAKKPLLSMWPMSVFV
jgi:hypothetical protein